MSVSIISFPQKTVDNNTSKVSKWSAVHHAMKFGLHRRDFTVVCVANTDPLKMTIGFQGYAGPISSILSVGDTVYLETPTGSGTFTITDVVNPNYIYVTRGTFTAYGWGYVNLNTRQNYFVRTQVWGVNENNNYYYIGTSINKPDATGRLTVDASSFLKSAVDYDNEFQYNQINRKDLSLGGGFNITVQENWKNFEGTYSGISNTELRYFVNSAKQIQDLYGSNMGEYVPFYIATSSPEIDDDAKFLSGFEKPTYFPDFPFDLSFIYSESLASKVTTREEEDFNVNGASVGTLSTQLKTDQAQNVNRLMITEPASGVKEVDVWLDSDGTADPVVYVVDGYVDSGYVQADDGPTELGDNPVDDGVLTDDGASQSGTA
jgi:hypothetical protein